MERTTVLVADDHPLLREGIIHLIEKEPDLQVVAQAADGDEAVRLVDALSPHVVIVDVEMPKVDGLEATKQIMATHPKASVLVLTVHDGEDYLSAFLDAGAAGYLLKSAYGEELIQAIRAVRLGEIVIDGQVMRRVLQNSAHGSRTRIVLEGGGALLAGEVDVLRLAARGMTNGEISKLLGIGLRAVKGHLTETFSKLGVGSRTQAIVACVRAGVLSPDDLC